MTNASRRPRTQLDLRQEARNLDRFRSNFAGVRPADAVSFPRPMVAEGLVSRAVLVETFVDGASSAPRTPAAVWAVPRDRHVTAT